MCALAGWSALAVFFVYRQGWILYYGDAEAHLNIARRLLDSRTPGYDQLGTVWLPLLHVLLAPFAANDTLWRTGLAAAIPSGVGFVAAGAFLFAAVRRLFGTAAAVTACGLFALNPNVLYLQSTAMTEPLLLAEFMALFYFGVRFQQTQTWGAVLGAAVAALAATLTRYDGWFLLPFAAAYFALAANCQKLPKAAIFAVIGGLGPLYWMAHNWWYFGDALAFYRGPYSALAIQGSTDYPGRRDWGEAWLYFRTAARLCAGAVVTWLAAAGLAAALWRRTFWPLAILGLPAIFYVWSIHSSGTPIFVPSLWPESYYNTRYGLALFPLLVFGCATLVAIAPRRYQPLAAVAVLILESLPWLRHPSPEQWVVWKESEVNSVARREWTREAADLLSDRYRPGAGIFTSFGDLTAIYRRAGIPLRETLSEDNGLIGSATLSRPDLFLDEEWAVTMGGNPVQTAINRAQRTGPYYALVRKIIVKGAPVIEIYRRSTASPILHDSPVYESAWRKERFLAHVAPPRPE